MNLYERYKQRIEENACKRCLGNGKLTDRVSYLNRGQTAFHTQQRTCDNCKGEGTTARIIINP